MSVSKLRADFDGTAAGRECLEWIGQWYPWNRSITGDGLRQQLQALQEHLPLDILEIPTGTRVLDWTVPKEWNIRDAYVRDEVGNRVVDYRRHNLHVMGYSVPVQARLSLDALKERCHTLPEQPDLIPYRTSYYREDWAFCASHRQLASLAEGTYEVCIDSTLEDGALSLGECVIEGETDEEILLSTHVCHPSLANDNLSAVAAAMWLARALQGVRLRHTYRFVFAPGTIGAIAWLAHRQEAVSRIRHGLVLACLGDKGMLNYKTSRQGDAVVDRAAALVLKASGAAHGIHPFTPYGYDERQYCSPGFNLPVGCLTRSRPGAYPEYHTSGDNPDLLSAEALGDSIATLLDILTVLEGNETCLNLKPHGEPQLGKRGLYGSIGGRSDAKAFEMALLWTLNFSDGDHSLLDIAERSGLPFAQVREAADALEGAGLLAPVETVSDEVEGFEAEQGSVEVPDTAETEASADDVSSSDEAGASDFWDDFLDDDDLDLSNETLADFFKDDGPG